MNETHGQTCERFEVTIVILVKLLLPVLSAFLLPEVTCKLKLEMAKTSFAIRVKQFHTEGIVLDKMNTRDALICYLLWYWP